jgi:hypothetical protein
MQNTNKVSFISLKGFETITHWDVSEYFRNLKDSCHYLWEGTNKLPGGNFPEDHPMKNVNPDNPEGQELLEKNTQEGMIALLMLNYMFVARVGCCSYYENGNLVMYQQSDAEYSISILTDWPGIWYMFNIKQDTIEPKHYSYYEQGNERFAASVNLTTNEFFMYPCGGGFVLGTKDPKFYRDMEKHRVKEFTRIYIEGIAIWDGMEYKDGFPCICDPQERWNGWASPYFQDFDTIVRIVRESEMCMIPVDDPDNTTRKFDIVSMCEVKEDYIECNYSSIYETEINGQKVWSIDGWCWEFQSNDELSSDTND